jgi:hypothetical protein
MREAARMTAGSPLRRSLARGGHGEGFFEDAGGGGGQMVGFQFVFGGPGNVGDVAAGARLAGDSFAEVVEDDEVVARVRVVVARLAENPFEHLDEFHNADAQARFFFHLAASALFEGLSGFEGAAGDGPLAFERLAAAADEQGASALDDHAADADHGAFRIFSGTGHRQSMRGLPNSEASESGRRPAVPLDNRGI